MSNTTKTKYLKEAFDILKSYGCIESSYLSYTHQLKTNYGLVYIRIDKDTMGGKLFSIYMMFSREGFNREQFVKAFLQDGFNPNSLKWNIHKIDAQTALDTLENRLDGLTYPIN